jgi:succinate dehydrogenase/fumarate reductase-like Fe-S protein
MAARMSLALRRLPTEQFLTPEWRESMDRIAQCTNCGHCKAHCPYGLDTPELLKTNYIEYKAFLLKHGGVR